MKLHGYFRSSAAYRVRIALNLKGVSAEHLPHHLRKGEQRAPAYLAHQSAGSGADACQDDRRRPDPVARHHRMAGRDPSRTRRCCRRDPLRRAQVRAFALALACDIHPVQNLKVLAGCAQLDLPEEAGDAMGGMGQREGLAACETAVAREPGPFCFGERSDTRRLCLVPQLGNARRFDVDVAAFPRLLKAEAAAEEHARRSPTPRPEQAARCRVSQRQ